MLNRIVEVKSASFQVDFAVCFFGSITVNLSDV